MGKVEKMILDSECTKRNILSTIGVMKTFIGDGGEGEYQNRKGEKKILSNLIWKISFFMGYHGS